MTSQYFKINLSQIIPDAILPCSVYFFFKGQHVEAIKKDKPVPSSFIAKSLLEENYFAYIAEEDKNSWQEWTISKRKLSFVEHFSELDENPELAARKAKYLQFASQNVRYKTESIKFTELQNNSATYLRNCVHNPILFPFFSYDFDENIFKHSARVSFLMILFISAHPALYGLKEAEKIIYSTIIHELKNNSTNTLNANAHQETFQFIETKKMIFPQNIIQLIEQHDSPYTGEKMDMGLRIFSMLNQFDHYYVNSTQNPSRKIRLEKTMEVVLSHANEFDPTVLEYFQTFISQIDYIV